MSNEQPDPQRRDVQALAFTQLVLLVEDDQSIARVLRFALSQVGLRVQHVTNGEQAVMQLETEIPDAVVLDLGLPDRRSSSVLAWLKARRDEGSRTPIWVVTSALDPDEADRLYGPFGAPFLAKPFDPWDLVR